MPYLGPGRSVYPEGPADSLPQASLMNRAERTSPSPPRLDTTVASAGAALLIVCDMSKKQYAPPAKR